MYSLSDEDPIACHRDKKQKLAENDSNQMSFSSVERVFESKLQLYTQFQADYTLDCCNEMKWVLADMLCFMQFQVLSIDEYKNLENMDVSLLDIKYWLETQGILLNSTQDLKETALSRGEEEIWRMLDVLVEANKACLFAFKLVFGVENVACCREIHSMVGRQEYKVVPVLYALWNGYLQATTDRCSAGMMDMNGICRRLFSMLLAIENCASISIPKKAKSKALSIVSKQSRHIGSIHPQLSSLLMQYAKKVVTAREEAGISMEDLENLLREIIVPHFFAYRHSTSEEMSAKASKFAKVTESRSRSLQCAGILYAFADLIAHHSVYDFDLAIDNGVGWVPQAWALQIAW